VLDTEGPSQLNSISIGFPTFADIAAVLHFGKEERKEMAVRATRPMENGDFKTLTFPGIELMETDSEGRKRCILLVGRSGGSNKEDAGPVPILHGDFQVGSGDPSKLRLHPSLFEPKNPCIAHLVDDVAYGFKIVWKRLSVRYFGRNNPTADTDMGILHVEMPMVVTWTPKMNKDIMEAVRDTSSHGDSITKSPYNELGNLDGPY